MIISSFSFTWPPRCTCFHGFTAGMGNATHTEDFPSTTARVLSSSSSSTQASGLLATADPKNNTRFFAALRAPPLAAACHPATPRPPGVSVRDDRLRELARQARRSSSTTGCTGRCTATPSTRSAASPPPLRHIRVTADAVPLGRCGLAAAPPSFSSGRAACAPTHIGEGRERLAPSLPLARAARLRDPRPPPSPRLAAGAADTSM